MLSGTVYPSLCMIANVTILLSQDEPHSSIVHQQESKSVYKQNPDRGKPGLAVAGVNCGMGKSTFTVNLALAARGLRVGLLDADIHAPNFQLMPTPCAPVVR